MLQPSGNWPIDYGRSSFNPVDGFDLPDSLLIIREVISGSRANDHVSFIRKKFFLKPMFKSVHHRDNKNNDRDTKRDTDDGYDADDRNKRLFSSGLQVTRSNKPLKFHIARQSVSGLVFRSHLREKDDIPY